MLLTVGHGTLEAGDLVRLVQQAGVESLVDVRRHPGSARNPQFGRDPLQRSLEDAGIAYRWDERLGGRRRGVEGSPNTALRNVSFRAYADHMATDEFAGALDELLAEAATRTTAVMCSESVWWRCHRRLIADVVALTRDVEVQHLMHDGRLRPHIPTDGVRPDGEWVVYDAGEVELPLDPSP